MKTPKKTDKTSKNSASGAKNSNIKPTSSKPQSRFDDDDDDDLDFPLDDMDGLDDFKFDDDDDF